MPDHRTLLQRLSDPQTAAPRAREEDTGRLRRSVLQNLNDLLNTQRGAVQSDPDYGLPTMSEAVHNFPTALSTLERAIKNAIRKYEPRLTRVRVTAIQDEDDPLLLRFDIQARLVAGNTSIPFRVQTAIDGSGRVAMDG